MAGNNDGAGNDTKTGNSLNAPNQQESESIRSETGLTLLPQTGAVAGISALGGSVLVSLGVSIADFFFYLFYHYNEVSKISKVPINFEISQYFFKVKCNTSLCYTKLAFYSDLCYSIGK